MSIYVLFFGGFQSTPTNMDVWLASAKSQRKDVDFDAIAYPAGAASDAHSAVGTFKKGDKFDAVITQIGTCGADQIYIVGHSSGCAIANAVDRELIDNSHIILIALDGFPPDSEQLGRPSTQLWSAACGDATSLNYDWLMGKVGASQLQVYPATDCKTKVSLHFSLVNSAATTKVVTSIHTGYRHCKANLFWLK
jgi:hypothetical protein